MKSLGRFLNNYLPTNFSNEREVEKSTFQILSYACKVIPAWTTEVSH